MRKFSVLIFIFCLVFIFGQKKKSNYSKNPIAELNDYTASEGKINRDYKPLSLGLRIKNYPFNKASKIKNSFIQFEFRKTNHV